MRKFPKIPNINKTTFPTCPKCRVKGLKEIWKGKGRNTKCIVICQVCGFNFIKEGDKKAEEYRNRMVKMRENPNKWGTGYRSPHAFGGGWTQRFTCENCLEVRWFKHKKFPRRWVCTYCGAERCFSGKN